MTNEEKFIYASYLYYELDISPISDYEYDMLARRLLEEYDYLSEDFKNRVSKEDLAAGTGHFLKYTMDETWKAEDWAESLGLMGQL